MALFVILHNSDDDSAAAASCLIFFQKSGLALLAGLVKNRLAKVHSALLAADWCLASFDLVD